MNSFNNIKRFKYSENQQSVISLQEYVILADDRKKEKYIVFKFNNNLNQILYGIRFEVVQYNGEGNIVEKNIIKHNQIVVGKNKSFIPEAKMKAHFDCARISVNLLYAHFTTTIWENGVFTPISYSFDDYKKDIPTTKTNKELKAEFKKIKKNSKTAQIQQATTEKIQERLKDEVYALKDGHSTEINKKNRFQMAEVSKKNKVVIPKILGFLLSFCFIFVTFFSIFSYSTNVYSDFSSGDFDYKTSGVITGYFGNDENVFIEEKVDYSTCRDFGFYINYLVDSVRYTLGLQEKKVIEDKPVYSIYIETIGDRAFSGSSLKKLVLPSSVTKFESEAFLNCINLNEIVYRNAYHGLVLDYGALQNTGFETFNYDFVLFVGENSLGYCKNLVNVNIANAQVTKNCFQGSTKIESVVVGDANVNKLTDLFGGIVPENLKYFEIKNKSSYDLPDGFLAGFEKEQIILSVSDDDCCLLDRLFI